MKKVIHINQHVIKSNAKSGEREPVITVKTYKDITMLTKFMLTDHVK